MCDSPPESVTGLQRPGGVYRAVPDAGRHGQTSLVLQCRRRPWWRDSSNRSEHRRRSSDNLRRLPCPEAAW